MHETELGRIFYSNLQPASNLLFTGEHTSWRIPEVLNNLGLSIDDLHASKDFFDIGSLDLIKYLSNHYCASYMHSNISRLVADQNRVIDAPTGKDNQHHAGLVKKKILIDRDGEERFIEIPHNKSINEDAERKLYEAVCVPYQDHLKEMIQSLSKLHKNVVVIDVHSFFPTYDGDVRKEDIDVMPITISKESAHTIRDAIRVESSDYIAEIDKPWAASVADGGVMSVVKHCEGVKIMAFDVKNSHLQTTRDVARVGEIIKSGINELLLNKVSK